MPAFRNVTPGYIAGFLSLAATAAMIFLGRQIPQVLQIAPLLHTAAYWSGLVYYFMVIHRIHRVLASATNGKYPVSGGRAVGFSFIPFFNLYWKFKWAGEIACFLNHLSGSVRFKKNAWGWLLLLAGLVSAVVPGLSLVFGFLILDQISRAILSVLPQAKLPVEDYTERYKSVVAVILACIVPFIVILGLLSAIAIPNFVKARNEARERMVQQSQSQPAAAPTAP